MAGHCTGMKVFDYDKKKVCDYNKMIEYSKMKHTSLINNRVEKSSCVNFVELSIPCVDTQLYDEKMIENDM